MDPTYSNREKLDDGDYLKSEVYIETESSSFDAVVKSAAFVDKTMFIKTILEDHWAILVTAPPGFGKSTVISMLKHFFEIQDKTPKSRDDWEKPVTGTSNYHLFVDNKLKITSEKCIMDQHFGKYPVIHADLQCETVIASPHDAEMCWGRAVRESFKQHKYLLQSERLSAEEKLQLEEMWKEKKFQRWDCLMLLSTFLFKHFDRKCFVLVDGYDSIINESMFATGADKYLFSNEAIGYQLFQAQYFVDSNNNFVERGWITGNFLINIPFDVDNILRYQFFEGQRYSHLYGLTGEEVDELFRNPFFKIDKTTIKVAKKWYKGYSILGETESSIYSIRSIVNFLKNLEPKNYWKQTRKIERFKNAFKTKAIRCKIQRLLQGKNIYVGIQAGMTDDDLRELQIIIKNFEITNKIADIFFWYLIELGYLTFALDSRYHYDNTDNYPLKIPNEEVKKELAEIFHKFI